MKIHEINGYIQSIYLAEYKDKLLLLDGCCRSDVAVVVDYIENTLNKPLTQLKLVVVTHLHPDHAGGAMVFRNRYKIPICSWDVGRPWYRGFRSSPALGGSWTGLLGGLPHEQTHGKTLVQSKPKG